MSWKKIGILGALALMVLPLCLSFVSAQENEGLTWAKPIEPYLIGPGATLTWTILIFSVIAIVIMYVILFDISQLALPFSTWVNIVVVAGLTLGAFLLGVTRTIVNFGLTIGATLAGTAGALATAMSGLLLLAALIAIFFGGNWLRKIVIKIRGRKEIMGAEKRAWEKGAKIYEQRKTEQRAAGME